MDVVALISLAFVASITPGPNNFMLFASGMNHGVRPSVGHVAGISAGFAFLLFVIALGLGTVFDRFAAVELTLKLLGSAYLAFLAWRIFSAGGVDRPLEAAPPLTFVEAAAFQWVNPKAWVMGTTASATLLGPELSVLGGAVSLTSVFWAVNLPCIITWLLIGVYASRWIDDERTVRRMNRALGVLLGLTVLLLLI